MTPAIRARTLYLLGSQTTDSAYLADLETVQAWFTDVVIERIPGQKHLAHVHAPEDFAARVTTFLEI